YGFIEYVLEEKKKWLYVSAVMLGFAVTAKLLSVGSLGLYTILFLFLAIQNKQKQFITDIPVYLCTSILVVSPWLVFSYLNTGNHVYPFFSPLYSVGLSLAI